VTLGGGGRGHGKPTRACVQSVAVAARKRPAKAASPRGCFHGRAGNDARRPPPIWGAGFPFPACYLLTKSSAERIEYSRLPARMR